MRRFRTESVGMTSKAAADIAMPVALLSGDPRAADVAPFTWFG